MLVEVARFEGVQVHQRPPALVTLDTDEPGAGYVVPVSHHPCVGPARRGVAQPAVAARFIGVGLVFAVEGDVLEALSPAPQPHIAVPHDNP